jgi:hypothetical protein
MPGHQISKLQLSPSSLSTLIGKIPGEIPSQQIYKKMKEIP